MVQSAVFGYLIGSIPFGVMLASLSGVRLQEVGSGNIGATNVSRALGPLAGLLVLLLDAGKGAGAAMIGFALVGPWGFVLGGIGAAIGHAWPFTLRFQGGKVVAVSLGVLLLTSPLATLVAILIFLALVLITRIVSISALLGASAALLTLLMLPESIESRVLVTGLWLLMVVRHLPNLRRLAAHQEPRLTVRR